ncbi:MAG: hypothetical protein R2855_10015 [Thermomicrobiales bacterium]
METGKQRGLCQIELAGVLVEVGLVRGSFDAGTLSVEDLVQVHHQDVLLGILRGRARSRRALLELARDRDIETDLLRQSPRANCCVMVEPPDEPSPLILMQMPRRMATGSTP